MRFLYRASFCNFTNVNLKRLMFYKKIHQYFERNKTDVIERKLLNEYGLSVGMSKKLTKDEIIGCIYAPFLYEAAYEDSHLKLTTMENLDLMSFFLILIT